ncbi:MAG: hypothetical protein V3S01_04135 [Dehalococcoidia bacterium]
MNEHFRRALGDKWTAEAAGRPDGHEDLKVSHEDGQRFFWVESDHVGEMSAEEAETIRGVLADLDGDITGAVAGMHIRREGWRKDRPLMEAAEAAMKRRRAAKG